MALQTINVGNFVNDGTGDDLRTAFTKVNANFEEIDLLGAQNNTASNIGAGVGLYKEKVGVNLRFKSLIAGDGISLTPADSDITIANTNNAIISVNADTGMLIATTATEAINIVGGIGVTTSISGNTLTITGNDYTLEQDTSPTLAGNLDLNGFNIVGGSGTSITAQNFYGTFNGLHVGNVNGNVTGLVNGVNPALIQQEIDTIDFGDLFSQVTNVIELLAATVYIDMGTFQQPNPVGIDSGTII
jgi:hypothetical protein